MSNTCYLLFYVPVSFIQYQDFQIIKSEWWRVVQMVQEPPRGGNNNVGRLAQCSFLPLQVQSTLGWQQTQQEHTNHIL